MYICIYIPLYISMCHLSLNICSCLSRLLDAYSNTLLYDTMCYYIPDAAEEFEAVSEKAKTVGRTNFLLSKS